MSLTISTGDGVEALADPTWNDLVDRVGTVFARREFLGAWWEQRPDATPDARLIAVFGEAGGERVGQCLLELTDGTVRFAGGQNVVDYMGPVVLPEHAADFAEALLGLVHDQAGELGWGRAHLMGLQAGTPVGDGVIAAVASRWPDAEPVAYDVAPGIDEAPDGYLAMMKSKRRADVLRKRKLLEEAVGGYEVVATGPDDWAGPLDQLMAWKATATPDMEQFVREYAGFLQQMFKSLAPGGFAQVRELRAHGKAIASAIVLNHREIRYLYNMSYERGLVGESGQGLAPGVVLVSLLAEQTLDEGWRFDFLKGGQDYKLRLGGQPREVLEVGFER